MALGCDPTVGAGLCGRTALHMGLRADWTRNSCAHRSAKKAGGGRLLSLCAKPYVCRLLRGMDRLWIIFGQASKAAIIGACLVVLGVNLFVMLYEEPTLRKMFGGDYEEYCKNVHRWLPRLRPWNG